MLSVSSLFSWSLGSVDKDITMIQIHPSVVEVKISQGIFATLHLLDLVQLVHDNLRYLAFTTKRIDEE